jgi:caffeoyl-CoA O-methyltransferase
MSEVLQSPIEHYINSLLPPRDEVLTEMEAYAAENKVPIIGPACGALLHQLASMTGAKRIFEMGSAIGYSTIWWARALPADGEVFYTDGSQTNFDRAKAYVRSAGVASKVLMGVGQAQELLQRTSGEFDIIFVDVDKHFYPECFDLALPRVRKGGLLVADNVLWHGRVVDPADTTDDTKGILEWNRLVFDSPHLETTIVPLRDGVSVSWKK